MNINYDLKSNQRVLSYLRQKPHNDSNRSASPDMFTKGNWNLNAHPDVAELLWKDFSANLSVHCQWVLFGTPVLVRPDTGVIFGIAEDINPPLLRLEEVDKVKILNLGGKQLLSNLDGVYADTKNIGVNWVYCFSFIENIEEFCYHSFLYAK